jgi:Uma2 family endonuclease
MTGGDLHSIGSGSIDEVMSRSEAYARLLELPDNQVGEILGGELVVSPRPASPHAVAAAALGMDLGAPFQRGRGGPGGWWILDEPELHLGDDVLVPDLAGWRRERMEAVPDVAAFTLAPDWICEVLSPWTAAIDRVRKMPIYARAGVAFAWLVDPIARTLETFELAGAHWRLTGGWADGERPAASPFEAIELELDALWIARPAP